MEYCPSNDPKKKGHNQLLPGVVIGVERRMVEELMDLWLMRNTRDLENHRVQIMILVEIALQLETFAQYAVSVGREDLAEVYDKALRQIRGILVQKKDLYQRVAHELDKDSVFFSITNYKRRWQKVMEKDKSKAGKEAPLTIKELVAVQKSLIISSGIEATEWIKQYAETLRGLVQDPETRRLLRDDPKAAEILLTKKLYGEEKMVA